MKSQAAVEFAIVNILPATAKDDEKLPTAYHWDFTLSSGRAKAQHARRHNRARSNRWQNTSVSSWSKCATLSATHNTDKVFRKVQREYLLPKRGIL